MAARRLVIVVLVLIAVSTVAAALAPRPIEERTTTTAEPEPPARTAPSLPPGRSIRRVLNAGSAPVTIALRVGDELSLVVRSQQPDQVEIPAFGLLEPVEADAPARFELIADREGSFGMRLLDAQRRIATIRIAPAPGAG